MTLKEAFHRNKFVVKQLAELGITTVAEAQTRLHDVRLVRGVGKIFIKKLMEIKAVDTDKIPTSLIEVNLKWIVDNFYTASTERLRGCFEFTLKMRG